jgi:hypothetical protein
MKNKQVHYYKTTGANIQCKFTQNLEPIFLLDALVIGCGSFLCAVHFQFLLKKRRKYAAAPRCYMPLWCMQRFAVNIAQ